MAKYNKKTEGRATINYMGGKSFKQKDKEALAHALLTSFIENSYYENKEKRLVRIDDLVKSIIKDDPSFVAKLALYLRKSAHMRSSFHTIIALLAKNHRGDSLVSKAIEQGTERVDDLTEILSALDSVHPIPNQIKKGIRKTLNKFDGYQLAKYRSEGKKVSLVDLFNLVHPVPNNENFGSWQKLINGELTTKGQTWEARLSDGESHDVVWKDMLKNHKLGFMACLRNLRNILSTGDSETIQLAAEFISNKNAVLNSKQLPFRFLAAYNALGERRGSLIKFENDIDGSKLVDALNKAVQFSVENIPLLEGKTVILSDNSGSMRGDAGGSSVLSANSSIKTSDIANLFALLYWTRAENTYVGLFGDTLQSPSLNRRKNIFENFKELNKIHVGPGTETGIFIAFEEFLKEKIKPNRIIIFSDCQIGVGKCTWYDYGRRRANDFNKLFQQFRSFSPDTKIYSIDLKGYGNTVFADGVLELAGWSERIFDVIQLAEQGAGGLIKQIEAIEL